MMESAVNPGMCRCCASEGAFKDIKSTYHWMGEEEIYSDMLRECFDIILNVSGQGEDGGICEVCITQLRNAINFKKQVLHTEKQFQKHLQNKTMFRPNIVKVEVQGDDDSDDNMASGDEGFSGNEFEVPIKTELDDPKPKKRAAKASATTTRASAKKAKSDIGETSTKRTRNRPNRNYDDDPDWEYEPKGRGSKRELAGIGKDCIEMMEAEITKHLANLKEIVNCSNATPFDGINYRGYVCFYCDSAYFDPTVLKKHTLSQHTFDDMPPKAKNGHNRRKDDYFMRLDITDLQCSLCKTEIDTLEKLIEHLKRDHKRDLHNVKNQLVPFKFDSEYSDTLKCCICPNTFENFRILQTHMNRHYRNFICEECDMGFVTAASLRTHLRGHSVKGLFKCKFCPKTFDTKPKAQRHETVVHVYKNLVVKCGYCNEKFKKSTTRNDHLMKVHGIQMKKNFECNACEKTFNSGQALHIHTRRDHLMERRFKCAVCEKAFFQAADLKFHMVTHTKTREFQCAVCLKMFTRKETLRQHMDIHSSTKRFKCVHCGQGFVQKISWKGHMRSKHGEIVV